MVKLNRIYTRTGDAGDSGLADGSRRPKDDVRFVAIGNVDETNAALGLAREAALALCEGGGDSGHGRRAAMMAEVAAALAADLAAIQNDLFDLGAELATPGEKGEDSLIIVPEQVTWLEGRIDALNAGLPPLRSFILPGGGELAARLHQARAVCRRAERGLVRLARQEREAVGAAGLAYVNRLSDYLFVAARAAARLERGEVTWQPGGGRRRS